MSRFLKKNQQHDLSGKHPHEDDGPASSNLRLSEEGVNEKTEPMASGSIMPPTRGDSDETMLVGEMNNPMILELNEEARKKAQQFIRRSFQDPMDLDEVSALRAQLQKQVVVTSSQLKGAVQSKLEALKRAADLMDESSLKLDTLSNTMRDVNRRVADSNTAISKHPHLRRVHNVRENVGKVISQVEFFARVRFCSMFFLPSFSVCDGLFVSLSIYYCLPAFSNTT
jgi:hypothetical protein